MIESDPLARRHIVAQDYPGDLGLSQTGVQLIRVPVCEPVARREIYRVELKPRVGNERGLKPGPATAVSNDDFDRHFGVVTAVVLTKRVEKKKQVYPFEYSFRTSSGMGMRASSYPAGAQDSQSAPLVSGT